MLKYNIDDLFYYESKRTKNCWIIGKITAIEDDLYIYKKLLSSELGKIFDLEFGTMTAMAKDSYLLNNISKLLYT